MLVVDGKGCAVPGMQHESSHFGEEGMTHCPLRLPNMVKIFECRNRLKSVLILPRREAENEFGSGDSTDHPAEAPPVDCTGRV